MVVEQGILIDVEPTVRKHPATYSKELYPDMVRLLAGATSILDPFGGEGGIFKIQWKFPNARIEAVEIEKEWAAADKRITRGNALALPWADGTFDAVMTSPAYGNRMADHHDAKDGSIRNTYKHTIGHDLHPDNGGGMPWKDGPRGDAYRSLHERAWTEATRVLEPGGMFVLNIKDFFANKKQKMVTDWHIETLESLGYEVVERVRVATPGLGFGANQGLKMEYEELIKFHYQPEN